MKTVPNSNAVIRVSPDVHRRAKIQAATDGESIGELVTMALQRELSRRQKRQAKASATPE